MSALSLHEALAKSAEALVVGEFEAYRSEFESITRRARTRFESRDWRGAQSDALERLKTRGNAVQRSLEKLSELLGPQQNNKALWSRMKELYRDRIAQSPQRELAETFLNSVTRRVFNTVGVEPAIEFLAEDLAAPEPDPGHPVHRFFPRVGSTASLLESVLRAFRFEAPYADLEGDAALAAAEVDGHLRSLEDAIPLEGMAFVESVFFRGKGAYLVGRLRRGASTSPIILALLHDEEGIHLDAVLLTRDEASIVFSFTRSYFHVEAPRPAALVAFLKSILPQRRTSELYIAIGHNKHGKTLLYREIQQHLSASQDRFRPARGDKGLVMVVFTLPSLDLVIKVIRDRFAAPKTVTRQDVVHKYALVFRHDRAGRLVDAQEFEHLTLDEHRFEPELLEELRTGCSNTVSVENGQVHLKHLYVERRVTPLNLYLRETDPVTAREAILDYGQSIRDLAATNTFPGDLLLKNFGVTRTGRVIFYDYDELTLVTDCVFRDLPSARSDDEEMSSEPWFYVGEHDIFPEEFLPFLGLTPELKQAFLETHAEILTATFWRNLQQRHRAGEIVDIFPYKQGQRLHPRGA